MRDPILSDTMPATMPTGMPTSGAMLTMELAAAASMPRTSARYVGRNEITPCSAIRYTMSVMPTSHTPGFRNTSFENSLVGAFGAAGAPSSAPVPGASAAGAAAAASDASRLRSATIHATRNTPA